MNLSQLAQQVVVIQSLLEKTILDSEAVEVDDEKGALEFLLAAREAHRMTGDIARIAEDMMVKALGDQRRSVLDGKTVEVRRAYRRTDWENSKVATHVAMRALGGEVIEGMDLVIDAFLKACNPSWRVTALKDMGLNDEDYCERELGRASVSVIE